MTLSRQRLLSDVLFVVLLLIPGLTALWAMHAQGIAHERVEHTKEVLADIAMIETSTSDAESSQRGYLLTGTSDCLRGFDDARPRIDRMLLDLSALTANEPAQQKRVEELGTAVHERFVEMDEDIHTRRTAGLDAAAARIRLRNGVSATATARPLIASLIASENHQLALQHDAVERLVTATQSSLIGSVVLLLVLTTLRYYYSRRHAIMPLAALARAAEAYGAGDLSVRLPSPRLDELRRLVSAFNTMAWQRQKAESDLRQATTFLETLIASSPIPIIGVDMEGRVRTWSVAAERQLGWTAREMIGQTLPESPPRVRAENERLVARVLGGESVSGIETETLRRDGTVIEVAIYGSPLVIEGTTLGGIALVVDISERKAAERDRARNLEEERYLSATLAALARAIVEVAEQSAGSNAGMGGVLDTLVNHARTMTRADHAGLGLGVEPDGTFETWAYSGIDRAMAERLGRQPAARGLLGWAVQQTQVVRLDNLREHPLFKELPAGHAPMGAFVGVPLRHGGRSMGTLVLSRAPERPPFTDIEQRTIELFGAYAAAHIENTRLSEALLLERGRLRLLAESGAQFARTLGYEETIDAVVRLPVPSLAAACVFEAVSGGRVERAGVCCADARQEDAIRPSPGEMFPDGEHPVLEVLQSGVPKLIGEVATGDIPFIVRGSRPLEVDETQAEQRAVMVIRVDAGDHTLGALIFISHAGGRYTDDDLKLAQEVAWRAALSLENARLYEAAQRAIRTREDVLAMVSHDLRTPLMVIQANADMAARLVAAEGTPKLQHKVEAIGTGAARMSRMINDFLDVATIESGRLSVQPERQPILPIIDEALDLLRPAASEKGIDLAVAPGPPLPDVRCDRARVVQVLGNLISNAVKFTPAGGRVTVSATARADDLVFSVTDTGRGLSGADVAHLFERFWRAREAGERGTGLGLYIARGIVEAHAGRIWAESERGRGSTFCFTLPIYMPASEAAVSHAAT